MFMWPGVAVACGSLMGLLDHETWNVGKTVLKYRSFLWNMYNVKRQVPTLNQTFLMMVKSLHNLPYHVKEAPWKTYADVKNDAQDKWPYLIRLDDTTKNIQDSSLPDGSDPISVINMSSYSYVNAIKETEIRDFVFAETVRGNYAFGNHGPRMLGGNSKWLCALEEALAEYTGRQAALTFSSGFLACKSAIQATAGPNDLILADSRIHESLRDGVRAACSKGTKRFYFRHNNMKDLESLLERHREAHNEAYIIIESVYSMDGDMADLRSCVEIADKYDARIILDEAHGLGVVGSTGRGLEELEDLRGSAWLVVGSFTKALGSVGGYICGDREIIDFLHFFATGTMFSAPMSVPAALAAFATLLQIKKHPEWISETQQNIQYLQDQLTPLEKLHPGLHVQRDPNSPLVALILKDFDPYRVLSIATLMRQRGFYVAAVNPPACPLREPRLRLTTPRGLTREQIDGFVAALSEACYETINLYDQRTQDLSRLMTFVGF